jgi:hypothetical protein
VTASARGPGRRPVGRPPALRWPGSPEVVIALILIVTVTVAAYAWEGTAAAVLVLMCAALGSLALLRPLPNAEVLPSSEVQEWADPGRTTITGFWRKRGMVKDATISMASYELELRATLQHLLAARLAERHGLSLYAEPDKARELVLPGGRGRDLWYWLDPERPVNPDQQRGGIPPRTLAAIIKRLEQL